MMMKANENIFTNKKVKILHHCIRADTDKHVEILENKETGLKEEIPTLIKMK